LIITTGSTAETRASMEYSGINYSHSLSDDAPLACIQNGGALDQNYFNQPIKICHLIY